MWWRGPVRCISHIGQLCSCRFRASYVCAQPVGHPPHLVFLGLRRMLRTTFALSGAPWRPPRENNFNRASHERGRTKGGARRGFACPATSRKDSNAGHPLFTSLGIDPRPHSRSLARLENNRTRVVHAKIGRSRAVFLAAILAPLRMISEAICTRNG